jgi:hypothetical protein
VIVKNIEVLFSLIVFEPSRPSYASSIKNKLFVEEESTLNIYDILP